MTQSTCVTERTPEAVTKRRYRVFLVLEAVLLALTAIATIAVSYDQIGHWAAIPLTILFMWHTVAVPICIMYLLGNPIGITLVPLFSSAESRAFRRRLKERSRLSDLEFHELYYAETGVPSEITVRLRRCLHRLDRLIERAGPKDNLCSLYDEFDFYTATYRVEKEFSITFKSVDYDLFDGTLGNLLEVTYHRIQNS